MYAAGLSKVPREFHLWVGISALAATIGDNVWYEKWIDEKLYPNLYVMLIGPSGTGKNQAWRRAIKRAEAMPESDQKRVNLYRGKVSAEKLLSRLGDKQKAREGFAVNRTWLVTPELAMQVGSGPKAENFITHMTELMDADQTLQDDTRTSGHFLAKNPLVNWGSGTTQDWLLRSVGKQDILGGFFARICAVPGRRSEVRYAKPIYPAEAREVNAWCSQYLAHLASVTGRFQWDTYADEYHTWWHDNRPEPDNPLLWHYYEHGDNLVHKLGMVLALSDGYKLVGEYEHMVGAITLYEWLYSQLPSVLEFAHRTPEVERLEMVAEFIASAPFVKHADLLRTVSSRGVTREQFIGIIRTLVERGDVAQSDQFGGRSYRWLKR